MATEQMTVLNWRRAQADAPWVIKTTNNEGDVFNLSIGAGGLVSAGPRLQALLAYMDAGNAYYPQVYDMQHLKDLSERELKVTVMNGRVTFAEATERLISAVKATYAPTPYKPTEERIETLESDEAVAFKQPWQMNAELAPNLSAAVNSEKQTTVVKERASDTHLYWVFMNSSQVSLSDGGSVAGYIDGFYWPNDETVPDRIGQQDLKIQQMTVTVDYLGIEAFALNDRENTDKSKYYRLPPSALTAAGMEARNYNQKLIKDSSVLAISLQYDTKENKPVASENGNLLGVVYATSYTSFEDAQSAVSTGSFKGIHINKSLLKEQYSYSGYLKSQHPESIYLPLVEFTGYHKTAPTDGLLTSSWAREFSLQEPPSEQTYQEQRRAVENKADTEVDRMEGVFERTIENMKANQNIGSEEVKARDYINNDLAFVPAKDDRIENGQLYNSTKAAAHDDDISEDLPYDYLHRVRIGDVIFEVPPLSIQVDKQHRNEKVQAMRTKTALYKQIGYVQNVLTMDLYFHDLDSINGRRVHAYTRDNGQQVFYYMDGLRTLLAQFKKTPFLPIDNDYINSSLHINNVALVSVSAQTVEGFPEALQVTLVLEEIDVATYMMGAETLGEKINYPLMRWYYQQVLQEPDVYQPWRIHLPAIDHLDNNFSFRIINEQALEERANLIHEFRQMKVPARMREELRDSERNEEAYKQFDSGFAKEALGQYNRFMEAYNKGVRQSNIRVPSNLKQRFPSPYTVPILPHTYLSSWVREQVEFYGIDNPEEARELAKHLYGVYEPNPSVSKQPTPHFTQGTEAAFYTLRTAISDQTLAGSMATSLSQPKRKLVEVIEEYNLPGFFILRVRDGDNYRMIEELSNKYQQLFGTLLYREYIRYKEDNRRDNVFLIPAGNFRGLNFLDVIKQMANATESIEEQMEEYTFMYNAMAAEINKTEENMPMDDFPISNLIPISLNVSLHNTFSSVQPQAAETPAKQFLGAQEPQIVVSFETNEWGIKRVDTLMRTVARYAKEYREGMVSGFMDIANPLVNLFGIHSVIPETVQFSTVPGHPERKVVTLGFVAFDKTQRRQEALYGFIGAPKTEALREIAFGNKNYDPNMTPLFVHEKVRHMELYPDLELPTIERLNQDLKHIGAGFSKWENRTNQIYLDPDFYISTNGTFRKYIKDVLDSVDGPVFKWEDELGIEMETNLKNGQPLEMTDEHLKLYEEQEENTEYIDPELEWEGWEEDGFRNLLVKEEKEDVSLLGAGSTRALPPKTFANSQVERFAKSNRWNRTISFSEWQTLTKRSRSEYDKLVKGEGPDEADAWLYLANAIRKEFGDKLLYAVGEVKALTEGTVPSYGGTLAKAYSKSSNVALNKQFSIGTRTWMGPYEFYWDEFAHQTSAWSKDIKLKNGNEKEIREATGMDGAIGQLTDSIRLVKTEMPFMRVMMYFKAIMSVESGWKTTTFEGRPRVSEYRRDGSPWKVGIMGVDLNKATSEQQAKRLMWDWRYNIDVAVKEMAKVYNKAEASDYREIRVRRLDWAVASHSGAALPPILESNDKKDDKPFGKQNQKITPDIYAYFHAVNYRFTGDALKANDEQGQGIYTNASGAIIPKIFNLYNGGKKISDEDLKEEMKRQRAIEGRNTLLWTNEQKLKGMYVDMYHYDQTGRMLRAFPSFSLQLIDEGKWYRNFRTWDNFYAYNALNSIDVYKSRKVAADTAIIEMSNMYGGLTGMRHDMRHFDFRMPSFFSAQFWSYYVWGNPTDEVLEEREQTYETIMLEPGARIQLRMGYGADAHGLPIVFNGTITEVNADEIVQIQAQSDALELTNSIGGSPDDTTKRFLQIEEPSEYIGRLMTTKGNWIRDLINHTSDGTFFKESPLGIAHFGTSHEATTGNWLPFQLETYEETLQNVYAQSSQPNSLARKQGWANPDGTEIGYIQRTVDRIAEAIPTQPFRSDHDEDNILLPVYGMTMWEIVQTFALCSIDYVSDVVPFEYRSSLYFGRPHWAMAYAYDSKFVYDQGEETVRREITHTHEKTFMQAHIYSSQYNILHNNIRASEEGVYNNVIVEYDGRTVGPMQADNDIRFDRQRTAHVQGQLMARTGGKVFNYWTTEKQAQVYGMSTVRDFMKDMYKGTYTVIGDPTVKPYDINYLGDTLLDMQGIHLVKAVHHSMSVETGFVSHIEPDAYVVNFDQELLFLPDKVFTIGKSTTLRSIGAGLGTSLLAYSVGAPVLAKLAQTFWAAGNTQKAIAFSNTVKEGLTRQMLSRSYEHFGRSIGNQAIVQQAQLLRTTKSKTLANNILTSLSQNKAKAIADATRTYQTTSYKSSAYYAKYMKNYTKGANKIKGAQMQAAAINKAKLHAQWAGNTDELAQIARLYKKGQSAQFFSTKGAAAKSTFLKIGGLSKAVLVSPLFWTVAITAVMHVATSGLVEMWSRKKQNAECVKVIPLEYKGRPMLAAMNGRRGSVVGDDPSLADRMYNATFGGNDDEVDGVWWSFVPKILNFMEGQ